MTRTLAFTTILALTSLSPIAQAQSFTVLHTFSCHADGSYPEGGVIRDSAGNLYGTTYQGGHADCSGGAGCGTVFKLGSNGRLTTLYKFANGIDGGFPNTGVIQDAAGNLYGTTNSTVFKLDPAGNFNLLHTFRDPTDGSQPTGNLILDALGNLYGTTERGGANNGNGTVYELDPTGAETILYRFAGAADGGDPRSGVIRDAAGNLFGTTENGGAFVPGTIFQVDALGNETVLHNFTGRFKDGAYPLDGLTADAQGNFYGTTEGGGANLLGTVFKLDTAGNETILYSFLGAEDGGGPWSGLVLDPAGNLYGTTPFGGTANNGTVFELDTTGKHTVLHRFIYFTDGADPQPGLTRDAAGNLYGTAIGGGVNNCGTVFKITP